MKDIRDMTVAELRQVDFEAEPFGYRLVKEILDRLEEAETRLQRARNHEW